MPSPASRGGLTPRSLNVIRQAMLGIVFVFSGVVFFLIRSGTMVPSMDAETARMLLFGFGAVFLGIGAGQWLMHSLWSRAERPEQQASYALVGYALGEAAALIGAIFLLLTGSLVLLAVGVLLFLLAFLLFPVHEAT